MPNKILLVDDEEDILNIVSFRLKKRGYDVEIATTGAQALENVSTEPPDLILLDINLPEINGCEVCRRLKANAATKRIPVIFLSASAENIERNTEECGADDFIKKPFTVQELYEKIGKYLNNGAGTAETNKITVEADDEIRELLPNFIREKNRDLTVLKEASGKNNMELIQNIGHRWRGSGSIYNLRFLTEKGAALEIAAKSSRVEEIKKLIPEIEKDFNNLEIKYVKAADSEKI